METISLCMIVKNEEQNLRGCLESAKPFVDEIIIVDTGSTDGTIAIAKEFEAKIVSFQWTENFSAARNESLKHATGNWILCLDADERLMEGFRLRALVKKTELWAHTLLLRGKRQLPFGAAEQITAYPRLFRRHSQIYFEGIAQEQILPSIQKLGKPFGASSVVIEHLGYAEQTEKVKEKCARNIALLEKQLAKNSKDNYSRYQLANMYVVQQEYVKAIPEIRTVLSSDADNCTKAASANLLVEATLRRNALSEAEFWCLQSLRFVRRQTMALWYLSGILAHDDKCEEALQLLHELKNEMHSTFRSIELPHDIFISIQQVDERMRYCYERLSYKAVKRNDLSEAEHWIEEAEEFGFCSFEIQRQGLEVALARNDNAAVRTRLECVIKNLPAEEQPQLMRLLALKAQLEQITEAEFSN